MIDLWPECGLPIQLDEVNCELILDESLLGNRPEQRQLEELREVLYQKDLQEPKKLYTLFNDVGRAGERSILLQNGLRYDLGIMPPLKMGAEYIKTMGHYHSICPRTNSRYAEVYEIIHGQAHFILQEQDPKDPQIVTDVVWTQAGKGDRLITPGNYAHVTINPGPGVLVMANIAVVDCDLSFSEIAQMGGCAYFDIEENGRPTFVRNTAYRQVPSIRKVCLKNLQAFGLDPERPIYSAAVDRPQEFSFLSNMDPAKPTNRLKLQGTS